MFESSFSANLAQLYGTANGKNVSPALASISV